MHRRSVFSGYQQDHPRPVSTIFLALDAVLVDAFMVFVFRAERAGVSRNASRKWCGRGPGVPPTKIKRGGRARLRLKVEACRVRRGCKEATECRTSRHKERSVFLFDGYLVVVTFCQISDQSDYSVVDSCLFCEKGFCHPKAPYKRVVAIPLRDQRE